MDGDIRSSSSDEITLDDDSNIKIDDDSNTKTDDEIIDWLPPNGLL
jgi:hypothetical protein